MADDGEKELRALCKLFIGGLPRSVTDDELAETFLKFCDDECLNDCVVIKDENKQSRGFGFVTYNRLCDTDNCLANRPHLLQGKEVEVKHAIPREDQNTTNHTRTNKIFVGGFPKDATEEDMTEAIENYTLIIGESLNAKVNKVDIIKSKEGGNEEVSRGFCFVEMATDDDADKVVIVKNFMVKGKRVEVKKAEPKGTKSGGGGGRGGGRGGNRGGSRMGGGGGGYNNYGGGRDNYFGGFGGNDYGGYGGYGGGMGGGASNYFGQMMNENYGFPAYNQSNSSFGPSRNSNGRYGGGNSGGGRGRGGRGGGGGGFRPY